MNEIVQETFNFKQFFQRNYGLGDRPIVPKMSAKGIVWGVILAIVGIIFLAIGKLVFLTIAGIVALLIGALLIALPIIKHAKLTGYLKKWDEEFRRRSTQWPGEFDKKQKEIIEQQDLEKRGMELLGIDEDNLIKDEKNGTSSFYIHGNNFDGGWRKITYTDGSVKYRTEKQEITWLYFGLKNLFVYKAVFSLMNPAVKSDDYKEVPYKKINSVSVSQKSVDITGSGADGEKESKVTNEMFRVNVPGEEMIFAYVPNEYTTGRINAMRSMIREMNND